jgi:transposase
MKLHANARTCPKSRALIARRVLEEGWSRTAAAEAAGVSERTAGKWIGRFRDEGLAGLGDRSSAPRRRPTRTPPERVEAIRKLRLLRLTAAEIAELCRWR